MAQKILILVNSGPGDPGPSTVAFMVARALVEKGHDVSMFLLNDSVYLMMEEVQENVQGCGLPPFEEFFLSLTLNSKTPIYIGQSCAVGRGLCDEKGNPKVEFAYGEIAGSDKLTELIIEADKIISL
jgi:predicted peroxiredoxin